MEERQKRYMNETYPCWYPVQIRFRDLDPLAHVNNTVYFIYFEEARSHYFNQLESWLGQWPSEEEHQHEVKVEEDEEPHNPRIQAGSHGHYGMLNEHERIFATGRSIMVWSNYYSGRPHPVPLSLRYAIEQMEGRAFPLPNS